MLLGYNTNGLAHHDIVEAIELLAEIGYRSVAITVDQHVLNPFRGAIRGSIRGSLRGALQGEVERVRKCLERHQMRSVIETGARFLLDPRTKHEPTLVTSKWQERERRIEFLLNSIELALELGSDCVSLWSGRVRDHISEEAAFDRLIESLSPVVDYAALRGVVLGFEPEPGMVIDNMSKFERLTRRITGSSLQLTLDLGHLHCQGELPIEEQIRLWGARIVNVHIEDMRRGVHEHLMFGEGEMDFAPILEALRGIEYSGGVHVELSRHSHEGAAAAFQAFHFLHPLWPS